MLEKIRQKKWFPWVLGISLVLLALLSRVCVAYFLANDGPGDGIVYAKTARTILEQGVYSTDEQAPFNPTYFRMPGYPIFLAGVYAVFGHENNTAVRIVQAVFDTGTCVILALIAFLWTEDDERKRRNALFAFVLATLCPFVVIYTATIMTETLTTFLLAAVTLTATLGLKEVRGKRTALWWITTGVLAGGAVYLRPDAGLFAGGIGLTLVISGLFSGREDEPKLSTRVFHVAWKGILFSLTFAIVLSPWVIRNYRVFGVFQPLSPAHGEMPGEFVPLGYQRWLRTWVDDFRFIDPMQWSLGEKPVRITQVPANDFDSVEERDRVAALLDLYNNPPGSEGRNAPAADEDNSADSGDAGDQNNDTSPDETGSGDDENGDTTDQNADSSSDDSSDDEEDKAFDVKMTPEIDAGFAVIADERIARSPVRYYLFLPAKRAAALWFDSHSLYYPFGGQMSPVRDLDYEEAQQYWLPIFTALMWSYTLLALGGALFMWRNRTDRNLFQWLILAGLMTLPRLVFFSTVENPEPRYVVELFAFTAVLGGIFLGSLKRKQPDEAPDAASTSDRLVSLDVFRGFTIAAMVLVDDPGTWDVIYPQLQHAEWNGVTFADWIFPFFLFIVGISIALSFGKVKDDGSAGWKIHLKIIKRAFSLFALGILLELFPFYNLWSAAWFEPSHVRIMGVLQRIAICYLATAFIYLHTNWKRQAAIFAVILLGYWALMTLVHVPGCDMRSVSDQACNLASYVDTSVLGSGHIWNQSKMLDPEGLLSTLPAIASTLIGVLAGIWLRSGRDAQTKFTAVLGSGLFFIGIGCLWSLLFPFNKSLWTSSYVVLMAGLAMSSLAVFYWLTDIKGYRKWALPFVIFGSNAIALFIGATILGKVLDLVELPVSEDQTVTLQERIFNGVFLPLAEPVNASLLFAVAFLLLWLLLLWPLYKKKIFLKV